MTGEAQIKELSQVETSKTSDAMQLEFGFGLIDLLRVCEQQKLMEDEKIKGFVKMFEMQRKSEIDAKVAKATPPPEMIKKILEEGKALGKAQLKQDGTMTFEFFLQTSKIVTKYVHEMTKDGLTASVTKRRDLLKAEKHKEYSDLVIEMTNWETAVRGNISEKLYTYLKVSKEACQKSYKSYLMDFEKRTTYEEEMDTVRDPRKETELSKKQVLEAVEIMEKAKFDVQLRMYDFVKMQRDHPALINARVRSEELKQSDILFNKTGIEEADVEPSINRLELGEDPEYKKIVDEWKAKSDEFLKARAIEEGKANHQAAEARRAQARIAL